MPSSIANSQKTAAQAPSARGPAPSRSAPSGGNAGVAAPTFILDEKPSDSALLVAQDIWGLGNLSPLDYLFASTAIMNLVPKLNMGFVGCHLGRKFHRYAEDTGIWIDAFETDLTLSRLHKKKNSTIRLNEWRSDPALLKKDRYPSFVVVQAGAVCASLESVYGPAANGLKMTGKLFAADLMRVGSDGHAEGQKSPVNGPGGQSLHTFDEHKNALESVGLAIEGKYELGDSFMGAIRSGLRQSLKSLSELQSLGEPCQSQRRSAFCVQLQMWVTLYKLAQKREISAIGLLATKRRLPAAKP
jgi:hypothetical protein